jgi:hypothetical protein
MAENKGFWLYEVLFRGGVSGPPELLAKIGVPSDTDIPIIIMFGATQAEFCNVNL